MESRGKRVMRLGILELIIVCLTEIVNTVEKLEEEK